VIPPGGEGQIKVTVRPKGRASKISKRIVVHTNDPDNPQLGLVMKGELLVDVIVKPSSIRIRDLEPGAKGSERFELIRSEDSLATIKSLTLDDQEHFSLREVPAEELANDDPTELGRVGGSEGTLGTYELSFNGRDEVGTSSTFIKVLTTGENTPELQIRVHANVAKNLRYLKTMRFTRRNGELMDRQIHISARHGPAPKITKVEDVDGLLDYEVQKPRGSLVTLDVAVKEDKWEALDAEAQAGLHELIISTTDAEEPEIVIRYRIAAKSTDTGRPIELQVDRSALPQR